MKYLLVNIVTSNEQILDNVLKDTAYNAKIKYKNNIHYNNILIPMVDHVSDKFELHSFISKHGLTKLDYDSSSVYEYFREIKDLTFECKINATITDNDFDIFYTDGSSSLKDRLAAYATLKLIKSESGIEEETTHNFYDTEIISGAITDGTNNIGELTGVKMAIVNADPTKKIHLIVSDSEYSLKSFREWIYSWRNNNYKNSTKKTILNCELIKSIEKEIESSNSIFLFKWVKGHSNNILNEMCDKIAKEEISNAKC